MFTDDILKAALAIGKDKGWILPSYEEIISFNTNDFVKWMIEHNPDKAQIIEGKFKI